MTTPKRHSIINSAAIAALASLLWLPYVSSVSGYDTAFSDLEDGAEPLVSLAKLVPRIGRRSINDESVFFDTSKRSTNNQAFPEVRPLMKPLPRVGRASQYGSDNILEIPRSSEYLRTADANREKRGYASSDTQGVVERNFLAGYKSLPRIGRRNAPGATGDLSAEAPQGSSEVAEDDDVATRHGSKRVPRGLTQMGSWSNSDLPWFRHEDGPGFPSKKNSAFADLVRMTGLPLEDAVETLRPSGSPLAVITDDSDHETPDAWSYSLFNDGAPNFD